MRKTMWEVKQAATPGTLELYIYGDVEGDGRNWWTDEVIRSETRANTFREDLAAHPDVSQINIYINSYGGSVFEGTAIYNQLKRHPARKTVYVDGFACSIASVIAMAGDEALMMVHNMWMGVCGNAAELRKAADDLDKINEAGRAAYLQKAGDKLTAEAITYDQTMDLPLGELLDLVAIEQIKHEGARLKHSAGDGEEEFFALLNRR